MAATTDPSSRIPFFRCAPGLAGSPNGTAKGRHSCGAAFRVQLRSPARHGQLSSAGEGWVTRTIVIRRSLPSMSGQSIASPALKP